MKKNIKKDKKGMEDKTNIISQKWDMKDKLKLNDEIKSINSKNYLIILTKILLYFFIFYIEY